MWLTFRLTSYIKLELTRFILFAFVRIRLSSLAFVRVRSRSVAFVHVRSRSFVFICVGSRSFTFVRIRLRSFAFVCVRSRSFAFVRVRSRSFAFVRYLSLRFVRYLSLHVLLSHLFTRHVATQTAKWGFDSSWALKFSARFIATDCHGVRPLQPDVLGERRRESGHRGRRAGRH